ncbi:Os10g0187701 [Oryza sativa Japonica Group]|uniref:Os10g0187701 protein n=1 Tax=Oryza sativa subsp. japonica TaxID=39947 RepID=A0A0P0XSZ4_ORYSJ|nr:Os10g0187701 [Oryza sativa Japonica Group]
MVAGHTTWNEAEMKAFPEACMEEIEARTITSTCPNRQGYINLEVKMFQKVQKVVNRHQLNNLWDTCRRQFQTWCWLESMATGLGCCPFTGNILASPEWWTRMDHMRRGARAFRNGPLLYIPEHHAVFRGRVCTLNRSGVPVRTPINAVPQQAEILDIEDLTEHTLQEPSEQTPRHGKRSLTRGTTSGGSSKRSRGSSASDALNRLADLGVQSNDSRTRMEEIKQAKSAKACMELLKADGYTSRDPIYHMALRVFRDGFLREFFLDDCHTPEGSPFFVHITAFCVDGFFGATGDAVLGAVAINAVGDDAATGDGEGDGVGDDDDDAGDGEAYGDGDDEGGDGAGDGHDDYGDDGDGGAAGYGGTGYHPLYNRYPNIPQAPPLRDWYDAPNSAAGMRAVRDAIADEVYNN